MKIQTLNALSVTLGAEGESTSVILQSLDATDHGCPLAQMCNALCEIGLQVDAGNAQDGTPAFVVKMKCNEKLAEGATLKIESLVSGANPPVILTHEKQILALRHAAASGVNCIRAAKSIKGI
jgi:hypothetical protein